MRQVATYWGRNLIQVIKPSFLLAQEYFSIWQLLKKKIRIGNLQSFHNYPITQFEMDPKFAQQSSR